MVQRDLSQNGDGPEWFRSHIATLNEIMTWQANDALMGIDGVIAKAS